MGSGRRRKSSGLGGIDLRRERIYYNRIFDALKDSYSPSTAWCFARGKGMIDEYIVDHGEYIGLGPGSFSYAGGTLFANVNSLEEYMNSLQRDRLPVDIGKRFTAGERVRYDFLVNLFRGVLDLQEMARRYGRRFRRYIWKEWAFLSGLRALTRTGDRLVLTSRGRYCWIVLMREFFSGVNYLRTFRRNGIKV
jgi:hypothetical protein